MMVYIVVRITYPGCERSIEGVFEGYLDASAFKKKKSAISVTSDFEIEEWEVE